MIQRRQHANGWFAEVVTVEAQRFRAQAKPPEGSNRGSVRFYTVADEARAKEIADNVAHPDCEDAEACAGAWQESE